MLKISRQKGIEKILNNNLCIGCGLCQSYLGKDKCTMEIKNGFYFPRLLKETSSKENKDIYNLCPAIHVEANSPQKVWGDLERVYEGWSNDNNIRYKASSGGFITAIAIYLLETGQVDGILHVGKVNGEWLYNELTISYTKNDIISKCQSRYAPSLTLNNIFQILDKDKSKKYLFIGKPCDITAIRNIQRKYPCYKKQFVLLISIFCGGMPSYTSSEKIAELLNKNNSAPINIKYRGEGWPGDCKVIYKDGTSGSYSYHYSWSKILSPSIIFRCKICPDGIGLLSDISVGDSWNTKDGYPDFNEDDGRSLIFVRNNKALKIIQDALDKKYITLREFSTSNMKEIQPAQYRKRLQMGIRILAAQLMTHNMLKFSNLCMFRHSLGVNPVEAIKIFKGTIIRFYKSKATNE